MRIISSIVEMQQQADRWRAEGKKIALVPTMGYLHEGHISLMRTVRARTEAVVASIFVNPTQFGPSEDFASYPRDFERDCRLSDEVGVDVIFAPEAGEMYPSGSQTHVDVMEVTKPLCGKSRPGHFRGVTTVVAKLFNIVKPHQAIFGEKDFQQLTTIRRMVADLNMDIEIIGHAIVREADDLAMSSRNVYLSSEERKKALRLNLALKEAQGLVDGGERQSDRILARVREVLQPGEDVRIDYAQLCRPDTLEDVVRIEDCALLALAVRVGATRLIDNRILTVQSS
ncbi:MAG: pantoate--beta-alanine ligase [Syntrophobacteraceae bacterium]